MTKAELIDIVSEQVDGVTKAQISAVYEAVFETIIRAVKEDEKHRFLVKDFGTFELKNSPARKGRNPKTGEELEIPARSTVKFRAAKGIESKLT